MTDLERAAREILAGMYKGGSVTTDPSAFSKEMARLCAAIFAQATQPPPRPVAWTCSEGTQCCLASDDAEATTRVVTAGHDQDVPLFASDARPGGCYHAPAQAAQPQHCKGCDGWKAAPIHAPLRITMPTPCPGLPAPPAVDVAGWLRARARAWPPENPIGHHADIEELAEEWERTRGGAR